jgi:hypothetical protein
MSDTGRRVRSSVGEPLPRRWFPYLTAALAPRGLTSPALVRDSSRAVARSLGLMPPESHALVPDGAPAHRKLADPIPRTAGRPGTSGFAGTAPRDCRAWPTAVPDRTARRPGHPRKRRSGSWRPGPSSPSGPDRLGPVLGCPASAVAAVLRRAGAPRLAEHLERGAPGGPARLPRLLHQRRPHTSLGGLSPMAVVNNDHGVHI